VTWGTGLGARGGRGSPEQGVPQRRNPSGGERRWWRGGAVEGADKVVKGAHGVGAELGAASRGLERGQSDGPQWLSDGEHGGGLGQRRGSEGAEEEEGEALHDGVLLL
jgi:hypothetical protein